MMRLTAVLAIAIVLLMTSCRSTRKITTAITKKDSVSMVHVPNVPSHQDTLNFINETMARIQTARIGFTTFSAKVNVDYQGTDNKKYDVNANVRMYKDSIIWISVTAIFGIEGVRAVITKDSVKILNKQDKIYTARSVAYLQEITALPLDLTALQDMLLGNPIFIGANNTSYSKTETSISLVSLGAWFKHLLTVSPAGKIENSKLDDIDPNRSRTCNLSYSEYENKKGVDFSTKRRITVSEKSNLDIKLDFKQYDFNETLSFPFSVPKNYKRN